MRTYFGQFPNISQRRPGHAGVTLCAASAALLATVFLVPPSPCTALQQFTTAATHYDSLRLNSFAPPVEARQLGLRRTTSRRRTSTGKRTTTRRPSPTGFIALGMAEPVSGYVALSVLPALEPGFPVDFYVDGEAVDAGYPDGARWNTLPFPDGVHTVRARVELLDGRVLELAQPRRVNVSNLLFSTTIQTTWDEETADPGGRRDVRIDISPYAAAGISSMVLWVDGRSVTLDYHGRKPDGRKTTLGSDPSAAVHSCTYGNHTARLRISDARGRTRESRHFFYVPPPPPVVSMTSPEDGRIYHRSLTVSGTARARARGARITSVEISVNRSSIMLVSTAGGPFSKLLNLSLVVPGPEFDIIIIAKDSAGGYASASRTVRVASSPQLAYAPYVKLPHTSTVRMHALDGTKLLYSAEDSDGGSTTHVHDLATGSTVALQGSAAWSYDGQAWSFAGDATYITVYRGRDCASASCVLRWDASGALTNLTAANPLKPGGGEYGEQDPHAKPEKVVSTSLLRCALQSFTAYDPASGSFEVIPGPRGLEPRIQFDFYTNGTGLDLFYSPQRNWMACAQWGVELMHWSSGTNATTLVSDDVAPGPPGVRTDGRRVAWIAGDRRSLVVMPAPEGPQEIVSRNVSSFALEDGVLAWCETPTSDSIVIKASAEGPAVTLQSRPTSEGDNDWCDVRAAGGLVAHAGPGVGIAVWSPAEGNRKVLDFLPPQWFFSGSRLVFRVGDKTLYSIPVRHAKSMVTPTPRALRTVHNPTRIENPATTIPLRVANVMGTPKNPALNASRSVNERSRSRCDRIVCRSSAREAGRRPASTESSCAQARYCAVAWRDCRFLYAYDRAR
ncbi:hypothetical protein DFJ74DRAFT_755334 [Hyaloraphidium curvatum]|nr:hypothetical protein DFJ74DRAFT_755334 [Hyaloraphidium curvatum]